MRVEFGKWLAKMAESDPDIVLLVGDNGFGIFDDFRKQFPGRYFNVGISEQAMVGIAAGLALEGMKPYAFTITPFLIERAFEQIKVDVDAQKANVKLVGYADYPNQGITHQELDAPTTMSVFKNIRSYYPLSNEETLKALQESYEYKVPTFISLKAAKK